MWMLTPTRTSTPEYSNSSSALKCGRAKNEINITKYKLVLRGRYVASAKAKPDRRITHKKIPTCRWCFALLAPQKYTGGTFRYIVETRMAAFQGMHVSPAKHSVTTKKVLLPDRWTGKQTNRWMDRQSGQTK